MSLLADLLTTLSDRRVAAFNFGARDGVPIDDLCDRLLGSHGEVAGVTLARQVLERYAELDDDARRAFFGRLATEFDIDFATVRAALDGYEARRDRASYRQLLAAAEPKRQDLIRRLNQLPGATGRLVAMRSDLLRLVSDDGRLAALDLDFRHLFGSWFNRGFLVLRPINWESPAHILEKIIAYEAVHAIDSWDDLRRRLQPDDRRCFAFFHPAMPDEPLIFVEVALTRGVAGSIQEVLAERRAPLCAAEANTAVFYSISNCQRGLAGISFGNSLIKQVVEDLSRELPGLRTFVTLSPIPSLMTWLSETGQAAATRDPDRLRALAAHYLVEVKDPNGRPRDPVARFHLGNGAFVHDLHPQADLSEKGRAASGGAMVNYLYDPSRISQNHERFVADGTVAASRELRGLSRQVRRQEVDGAPKAETE